MPEPEEQSTSPAAITRPIQYLGVEDVFAIFADQAIISHASGMFSLLFFQMQLPLLPTEDTLQHLEVIPAKCVGRFVLTPMLMQQFASAIQSNMERFSEKLDLMAQQSQPTGEE